MIETQQQKELLHKAAAYCSNTERCIAEVCEKLNQWGLPNSHDQQAIIDQLIKERFIDELRYCRSFVNDKFKYNKWGKIKIAYALKQKMVNRVFINDALELIDEEEYLDSLSSILKEKSKTIRDDDPLQRKAKLFRFAASRGFESDTITKCLHKFSI